MKEIRGNTFPVRAKLAELGGRWNKVAKCWEVPDDKATEAEALVKTPVRDLARAAGQAYYVKMADGSWAVCSPVAVANGTAIEVRTKAGKVNTEIVGECIGHGNEGQHWVYRVVARVKDKNASWAKPATARAILGESAPVMRDPGEDSADRWNEGGGVA
jgi:hypothetical protein